MSPPLQDPQRLKRRRIEAGLNQRELAAKAGIKNSTISAYEHGRRGASPRVLKRIAEICECTVADLLPPESDTKTGAQ
jgi:transcriptional regulator with XRE-family HTH domain